MTALTPKDAIYFEDYIELFGAPAFSQLPTTRFIEWGGQSWVKLTEEEIEDGQIGKYPARN